MNEITSTVNVAETAPTVGAPEDHRDAMMAAAAKVLDEAKANEPALVEPEGEPALETEGEGTATDAKKPKVAEKAAPAKSKLEQTKELTEKKFREREAKAQRQVETDQMYRQTEQAYSKLQETQRLLDHKMAEVSKTQALFEKMKRDPVEALNALGMDMEQFVELTFQRDTPEFRRIQKVQSENDGLRSQLTEIAQRLADIEAYKEKVAAQNEQYERNTTTQKFFELLGPEGEAMQAWDEDYILQRAIRERDKWQAEKNEVVSLEDLAQYINYLATKKKEGKGAPDKAAGSSDASGKQKTQKPRSLTQKDASKASGLPKKAYADLDEDEQKEFLRRAVMQAEKELGG